MVSIQQMVSGIQGNINEFNSSKKVLNSVSAPCVITNVNERKFTVDVFVPQSGATYIDVIIGTSLLGSAMQIKSLPSKHQKGIILISNQHPVTLIATIPNTRQELQEHMLMEEAIIGNKNTKIKICADNTISMKTSASSNSFGINGESKILNNAFNKSSGKVSQTTTSNGCTSDYEKYFMFHSTEYFKSKNDIMTNESLEDEVINQNSQLLSGLNTFIEKIESFSDSFNVGSKEAESMLNVLSKEIDKEYGNEINGESLEITKGTLNNDDVFSIKYKNGTANASLSFMKDGTIEMNCKDFIMKKG